MANGPTRRELMKTTAAFALGSAASAAESAMPKGQLGKLKVSRILLGGNLLARYTHSRDLKYVYKLAEHYNTDEKLMETMALAEEHGIDTLAVHPDPAVVPVLKRHRARGGKIKWILCTEPPADAAPEQASLEAHRKRVAELVDHGADAIYFWGVRADQFAKAGNVDLIAKAIDVMKATKLPVGIGAHSLGTVVACEKAGIDADFYMKTLHHHDYRTAPKPGEAADDYKEFPGYWCGKPQETVEFMSTVKKPWIAFKVMAAGAIPPQNAFRYAFEKGADFIVAGMFDFEIAEDVRIANGILADLPNRTRAWRA